MAETQPEYIDDLCYSANDLRLNNAGFFELQGAAGFAQLLVTETSPASGDVKVSEGHAFVFNDNVPSGLAGVYHIYNDASVTLTVPLNSTGSDRTDVVWAQVCDSEYAAVTSGFTLIYDDNNPTATVPADGCTYYELARIVVPNGAGTGGTNITGVPASFGDTDGMIEDTRNAFILAGDDLWADASASLNFPSIAAATAQTLTISVPGADINDEVTVGPPATLEAGLVWGGVVSSAGTVAIRLTNITGIAIDPATATWSVAVRTR